MNLTTEFERLNDEQKDAVRSSGNTVVLAGPGSGKTATLVVKLAHLLAEKIDPPAGVACITYNNDAVGEFRRRLAELGVTPRRSVFLGTVHSFCLNCILRPYARLVDPRFKDGVVVANTAQTETALAEAAAEHMPGSDPRWLGPVLTRFRRARACGEDLSGFAEKDPLLAQDYEDRLLKAGLIDFEGMVVSSLELIRYQPWVRELLAARFPWLLVDEYQDLGGPLHRIVTHLAEDAGIRIFAVGDPDQTIYDFTGANPKYLNELRAREDFEEVRLKFNYRSGQRLIDASQAALAPAQPRGYVAHPSQKTRGEVFLSTSSGTNADFSAKVAAAVLAAIEAGEPLHDVAILYRSVSPMLEAIRTSLTEKSIPFVWERDERFPGGPLVRWLQQAAAWSVAPPETRPPFRPLFREFSAWAGGHSAPEAQVEGLELRAALHGFLGQPMPDGVLLRDWLATVDQTLGLQRSFRTRTETAQDKADWESLVEATTSGNLTEMTLLGFAGPGQVKDKVVITTLHGSKGRQFGVVIVPGCAEGVLPAWTWNRRARTWDQPTAFQLSEARRLFYVGVTRARRAVHLVHSNAFENRFGMVRLGTSRFIAEIQARLG